MQYKIPQNVQIEDKIVGPLTLKQLIILGLGGGLTYLIYTVLASRYFIEIWLPAVLPPALLTLAFTFVKINGVPFGKWLLLLIEYFFNPRKRTFVMGGADTYSQTVFAKAQKKKQTGNSAQIKKEKDRQRIQNLGEITKLVDDYQAPSSI